MHCEVNRRLKRHMVVAWGNEWVDGEKEEGFQGERKGQKDGGERKGMSEGGEGKEEGVSKT